MLTGNFQEGETPREKFGTKVAKDAPLLGDRDVGDVQFLHIPGHQAAHPTPHLSPPKDHGSRPTHTFFTAYVRGTAEIGWGQLNNR